MQRSNKIVTSQKDRIAILNEQVQTHTKAKTELEAQVKELTAEVERLKQAAETAAATTTGVAAAGEATAEIENLKSQLQLRVQEKEKVEKELAEERSRIAQAASEHNTALVCCSTSMLSQT